MEEEKGIDLAQPQSMDEFLYNALWQWQSGPDPWTEKDPAKRTWQDYSDSDCLAIEEAFSLKKEIADLGNYEIDLKKMLQVNKMSKNKIRRVRRQEKSRFMIEMPEPVAVVRAQKTMNQAFGTIQHFLDFIMKRTPEAYGLYQRLKNLKLESQSNEFEEIIKEVVTCIQKGAEVRERIVQTRSAGLKTNFLIEAKRIVDLIKGNTQTLGDFFKAILKAYTMESFICYWLNELLRSENWEEINVLTPYLVCLVYTFKLSEYIIKYQEPQGFMNSLFAVVGKQKLNLYRGTALTREHLELYDRKKIKYFSWNGVTSTSRDESVALGFIELSIQKVSKLNESKVGVLFKIETDFASSQDCEGMIDIATNSRYPKEKEVILAPGTVFKLQKIRLVENNIYKVSLLVKKKFEETKENIALLGALQDEAILKDKAIIDGLPSQQSFRLLEMLKGNKLIRKIEVKNSGIEEHLMEEIESLRATTNVRKEDFKLRDNTIVVSSLGLLAHYFSVERLNDLLMFNKIRFKDGKDFKGVEIKTLIFSEECLEKFRQNNRLKELSSIIKNANELENLELAVPRMEGSDCEWTTFLQCIRESKGLQGLKLKINESYCMRRESLEVLCQTIESSKILNRLYLELSLLDEEFEFLKKALEPMKSIKNLSLALQFSGKMSDQGIDRLKSSLLALSSLQHLSLNFKNCEKISDEGLNHLKGGLLSLLSLQHLSVNFSWCKKISDEGLNYLKSGLLSLSSLHHLSFDFSHCNRISDEGLNHLKSGLLSLSSLQHLSLNVSWCKKISNEGLKNVSSGLISLTSLQHLSLHFGNCFGISNEGLNHLKSDLLSLTSLHHLSLNFDSNRISDEGLNHLKSGLLSFSSLKNLSLDFNGSKKISNEGLYHLKNGLLSLSSLKNLSLDFGACNISDEGLNHLKSGLLSLSSLQHLSLDFKYGEKISDEGLNHLKSGLLSLSSLQHLSLDFKYCEKISDEGLNHLKSGLLSLSSLQNLSLDFVGFNKISNEGLNHLKSGLLSLSSLQYLSLNFSFCKKISDEGLNYLKSGLLSLSSLHHLSFDFSHCNRISDEGLNHLKSGLLSLSSLQHLSLDFSECWEISDKGLNHLKSCLLSFSSLQRLSLNFMSCYKISDEGLNHLRSGILSLSSLQHVSMNLLFCHKISDKGRDHLRIKLKSIPTLFIK